MTVDLYVESRLHNLLTEDARVAEPGIEIVRLRNGLALLGEVESAERRDLIMRIVREALPDVDVRCDIAVTRVHEPDEVEEL